MSFTTEDARAAHGHRSSIDYVQRGDRSVYSPARFYPLDPNVSLPARRHPERRSRVYGADRDFGMDTLSTIPPQPGYFGGATSTLRPEFRGMMSSPRRELDDSPVFDSGLLHRRRARRGSNASLDSLHLYGRETGRSVPHYPQMRHDSDASIDNPHTFGYGARDPSRRYDLNGPVSPSPLTAAMLARGAISPPYGSSIGFGSTRIPDFETFPFDSPRSSFRSHHRRRPTMGSASQASATDDGVGIHKQSELTSLYSRLSMCATRLGDLAAEAMLTTGVELSVVQMHIGDMQGDIQQIGYEIRRAGGLF